MSRIFLQNHKFHQILPSSFHEGEFEHIITHQAPNLYPDYFVIPFKKTVISPYGKSAPDLIFIAKDYKDWYVVEVEMAYHSFNSHIEPQIRNLAFAEYYDADIINYICNKCTSLDFSKTSSLIRTESVKILLILNEMNEDWKKELRNKYSVVTSVFNVFHNNGSLPIIESTRAYGIGHNYPVYSQSITTTCTIHPYLNYLGIDDNSNLKIKPGEHITLEYNNYVTFWEGIEGPGRPFWLRMDGRDELINKRKTYQIVKLRDNSLLLDAR